MDRATEPPGISVIIPALNEEALLPRLLENLRQAMAEEILVVDGGSRDNTVRVAEGKARVLAAPASRAAQMNAGAACASQAALLFLHADVTLGAGAIEGIRQALRDPRVAGGNLNIVYEGGDMVAHLFSWINRMRCRIGIFYGDSGIFCRRDVFQRMGGFRNWPLMEDYEFVQRLKRQGRVVNLPQPIYVSDRRWRRLGVWRTLWTWFWIQTLYCLGVPPARLARWYRNVR